MKPKLALAALLVLVTVGASGQEPKPSESTLWTPQSGVGYMRACGHQKWCFSFNGGPEISADELADRAKMLERIAALEKRVAELEAWKKNLHLEVWNPSVGKPKCCTINSDPEISTVKP